MATYDLFRKIALSSLTEKEREVHQIKHDLSYSFEAIPSFYKVNINNVEQGVHIISDKNTGIKQILSKPDESFNCGDIVDWNNSKWLISQVDTENQIQTKGIMLKCNDILTLYKNYVLYQIPCVVESGIRLYQLGTDENTYIETPSTVAIVRVSDTEITRQIMRNDVYKIGMQTWRVVDINDILEPGLLILKLEWCAEEQSIPSEQPTYVISGDDEIRVGSVKTYQAIKYINGIADPMAQFDFSIIDTGVPISAYTMTILNDTSFSIECKEYVYYLTVRATDRLDNTKFAEIQIRLSDLF